MAILLYARLTASWDAPGDTPRTKYLRSSSGVNARVTTDDRRGRAGAKGTFLPRAATADGETPRGLAAVAGTRAASVDMNGDISSVQSSSSNQESRGISRFTDRRLGPMFLAARLKSKKVHRPRGERFLGGVPRTSLRGPHCARGRGLRRLSRPYRPSRTIGTARVSRRRAPEQLQRRAPRRRRVIGAST